MTLPVPTHDTLLSALRDGLGARHVLTESEDLAPYLVESRKLFTGAALALQINAGGERFQAGDVVPAIVAIGDIVAARGTLGFAVETEIET